MTLSGICVLFRVLLGIVMSFIAIIGIIVVYNRKKERFHFSFLSLPIRKSITGLIRLGINQLLSFL